jgi:hypothetical protein
MLLSKLIKGSALVALLAGNAFASSELPNNDVATSLDVKFQEWAAVLGSTFASATTRDQASINRSGLGGRFITDYFEVPLALQRAINAFNARVNYFNQTNLPEHTGGTEIFTVIEDAVLTTLFENMHFYMNPVQWSATEDRDSLLMQIFKSVCDDAPTSIAEIITTLNEYPLQELTSDLSDDQLMELQHGFAHVNSAAGTVVEIADATLKVFAQLKQTLTEYIPNPDNPENSQIIDAAWFQVGEDQNTVYYTRPSNFVKNFSAIDYLELRNTDVDSKIAKMESSIAQLRELIVKSNELGRSILRLVIPMASFNH